MEAPLPTCLPDDLRAMEPPDPLPNSEVKRCIADGSVGFPHVRVGHRQALKAKTPIGLSVGVFLFCGILTLTVIANSEKQSPAHITHIVSLKFKQIKITPFSSNCLRIYSFINTVVLIGG